MNDRRFDDIRPPEFKATELKPKKEPNKRFLRILAGIILVVMFVGAVLGVKAGLTYSMISIKNKLLTSENKDLFEQEENLYKDSNRVNILLIGIRGAEDPNGGLLSDMLLLVSIDKKNDKVALISIPRDLYVEIPGLGRKERINFAYAYGEQKEWGGGGIGLSKRVAGSVTGVYIDYAVSVNFDAFLEVIDQLGGIDVYVPRDFSEPTQWGYPFLVPKGWNHMDSETTLYYVRSRFSSSDFDRARREQDVAIAIKNRVLALNVLANPVKIFNFLDVVGNGIRTDMDSGDIKTLLKLAASFDEDEVIRKVLDTGEGGYLYSAITDAGAYILLPVGGNFSQIKNYVITVFD